MEGTHTVTDDPNRWLYTVHIADIRQDGTLGFKDKRDAIVQRLRYSNWCKLTPYPGILSELLNVLGAAETPEEFDRAALDVFDLADSDGVWIEREGAVVQL